MILTNEFLRKESIKRDINNASETRILNENYAVFSKKESYDLFISHCFLDKKLILTLIDLFNNAGYSVYVDWINDKTLDRNNVSPKTAKVIKNRWRYRFQKGVASSLFFVGWIIKTLSKNISTITSN